MSEEGLRQIAAENIDDMDALAERLGSMSALAMAADPGAVRETIGEIVAANGRALRALLALVEDRT